MMTQIFKHAFFNHAFKDILKLIKLGPTQFRSNQNIISSSEDEESNLIDIKPVSVGESSFLYLMVPTGTRMIQVVGLYLKATLN